MRTTLSVIAAALVGLTATSVQSATAAPAPVVRVAAVTAHGRVLTAAGKPITGAIVSVVNTGHVEPIVMTRTDADGNFSLGLPEATGNYSLRIIALGYTPVILPLSNPDSLPTEITMQSFTGR